MMLGNYKVPDKELRVSISMQFDSEKLGAQTSGTDSAHKGIKPKTIYVSLLIPFVDSKQLTELTAIAEAVTDNGNLRIYDIVEPAANAMKIRKVRFCDSFSLREDYSLKAWQVNFSLEEYNSVAEKTEQRQKTTTAKPQAATGTTVSAAESEEETEEAAPVTGIESYIASLDKVLS